MNLFAKRLFASSSEAPRKSRRQRRASQRRSRQPLGDRMSSFQSLERRIVLDAYTWIGSSGDWFDAANWRDTTTGKNAVPDDPTCAVTISTTSPATITIGPPPVNTGASAEAGSIDTGSNDTLSMPGNLGSDPLPWSTRR